MGFSLINPPLLGTPIDGNIHIVSWIWCWKVAVEDIYIYICIYIYIYVCVYVYIYINMPDSARPAKGRMFRNVEINIGRRWPIGTFLRCRSNELLKSWGASTNKESMKQRLNESMSQWTDDAVNQWTNDLLKQLVHQSMNQWINEPYEPVNQWANESLNQQKKWIIEWTDE